MRYSDKQLAQALLSEVKETEGKALQTAVSAFVEFLTERGMTHRVRGIIKAVDVLWKEKHGIANVSIETAEPLSDDVRQKLTEAADGASIEESVNKQLIGGAKIQVDDYVIDGSIKGRLEDLKQTLARA